MSSGLKTNSKSSNALSPVRPGGHCVGAVAWRYLSVNSTICTPGEALTALIRDRHATLGSSVSVKYVQGGENRLGFLTADVDTPFAVADIPDSRPSVLNARSSPRHVTIVRDGSVEVVQPFLPADVAAKLVGISCTANDVIGVTDKMPMTLPRDPITCRRDFAATFGFNECVRTHRNDINPSKR